MSEIAKITLKSIKYVLRNYYTYAIILVIIASYFTVTPFIKNTTQTPDKRIYLGAENNYRTYFKYLKTTLTGQNLPIQEFKTKLNSAPLDEKYYLLKGRVDSVLSQSHFLSYHLSRFIYNFLFFLFLYLIISHLFKSRTIKLSLFSFLSFFLFPFFIDFSSYPHFAFLQLLIITIILIKLKLLRKFKLLKLETSFRIDKKISVVFILFFLILGYFQNQKLVKALNIDIKGPDKEMLNLIYLSKDFYAGIGYLRDNAEPGQKVVCFKKCAIVSDLFAGVESVIGPFDNLSASREMKLKEDLPGIFDNIKTVMKELESEKAAYFFIGPEEKPYTTPDFTRLQIKEVIKNKDVTVYKILPPLPTTQ